MRAFCAAAAWLSYARLMHVAFRFRNPGDARGHWHARRADAARAMNPPEAIGILLAKPPIPDLSCRRLTTCVASTQRTVANSRKQAKW
jgi:hypothetical protein